MIRVALPAHLRTLAGVERSEVELQVAGEPTMAKLLDALEEQYPALRGTVRDYAGKRRPFLRFFACASDISHDSLDNPLPDLVASGLEPILIVGAIAGG